MLVARHEGSRRSSQQLLALLLLGLAAQSAYGQGKLQQHLMCLMTCHSRVLTPCRSFRASLHVLHAVQLL